MKKSIIFLILIALVGVAGYLVIEPQRIDLEQIPSTAKMLRTNYAALKPATVAIETQTAKVPNALPLTGKEELDCFMCHDATLTKGFHVPEKIIRIEAGKGKRRRVCVDCHGASGANADVQMTDPNSIHYDPNVSVNGLFKLDPNVPHLIHRKKLLDGNMECGACHLTDYDSFDIQIPKADVDKGQVLLCQSCKFHPEGGNYITIHIEVSGLKCTICHTGNLLKVHQEATSKLGAGG